MFSTIVGGLRPGWVTSVAIAAFVLSTISGSPVNADDAQALLAKHKAYVGWEFGDGTFRTFRIEGSVRATGAQDEYAHYVELRSGVIYRQTYESKISTYESGFTGKAFWFSDENGFTVPELGDEPKVEVAQIVVFNEATTTLAASIRRNDTIDGTPVVVLRETIPNGFPVDLYEDPESGAYRRAVVDPDGAPVTIDIDAYGDVGGKKVITAYHFHGSKYLHTEAVTPNVKIADEELRPPPTRARWVFATNQPFKIEVTDHSIFVIATLDGVKGRFILDTGSSQIATTNSFARRANLRSVGETTSRGLTGSGRTRLMEANALVFPDGSRLEHVIVNSGLDDGFSEGIDGLLGFDFLAGAIVDVDLDAAQITLYDPKVSAPSGSEGVVVQPDLNTGTPVVPVKVNGTQQVKAMLDSGDPIQVLLPNDMLQKLSVLFDRGRLGSYERFYGAVGEAHEDVHCGQLGDISLGAVDYQAPPACFTRGLAIPNGIIGFDFLKHFNFTFDYPDGQIVMVKRKS